MSTLTPDTTPRAAPLRPGERIVVRSEAEILATLDADGRVDGLPFMPEMLAYCGQTFRVFKRADKTCDTVGSTAMRRLHDTVHLEMLRCDGSAHGGCQAECLLYWKEAWLARVDPRIEWAASDDSRRRCRAAPRVPIARRSSS